MKRIILAIICIVFIGGCCTTHYTPMPSATIQPPAKRPVVKVEVWKLQDPVTKQERKIIVLSDNQLFLVGAGIKIDDRFIQQCLDLIGPKQ